jgi:hypothetical protein
MIIAVDGALQGDDIDTAFSDEIVVILGLLGKDHIKALYSREVTGMDSEEYHLFIGDRGIHMQAFVEAIFQQRFLLRKEVFLGGEDCGDVVERNLAS